MTEQAVAVIDVDGSKQCRICLEEGGLDLIAPCRCKGSSKWIHRNCLDQWRATKREGRAFTHCVTCDFEFVIQVVEHSESEERCRKIRYTAFVARDTFALFLLLQCVIAGFGGIIYACDVAQTVRHLFPPALSNHPIPTYYLAGLILFLAILGVCGLVIACSSNNRVDPCPTHCYVGNCNCNCQGSSNSNDGCLAILVVIILLLAFLGLVLGVFLASVAIQRIMQRHMRVIWLKEEAKKYVVQDMDGQELPTAQSQAVPSSSAGETQSLLGTQSVAKPKTYPDGLY